MMLYIFFLFSILLSIDNNIETIYEKGMHACKKGKFNLAIQEFEFILTENWESPELYYNLGNSYYRSEETGAAIWAYENCLRLAPYHKRALYNLKLANLKVKDKIQFPEAPIYLRWYFFVRDSFTPTQWINIFSLIIFLFVTLILIRRIIPSSFFAILRGSLLIFLFGTIFITLHSLWIDKVNKFGIIYTKEVQAKSEPNYSSTSLFKVHEGLKVLVNQIKNDWIEVELIDGKTGWIEMEKIRLID